MKELVTIMLCFVGWGWAIRAGIKPASWAQSGTTTARRVAIGNSLVALIPFAWIVFINWEKSISVRAAGLLRPPAFAGVLAMT